MWKLGAELGLSVCRARLGFSKDLTFGQVRELVVSWDAPTEARDDDWLHGFWEGTEVFVVPFTSATSGNRWTVCVAKCEIPAVLEMASEPKFGPLAGMSRASLLGFFMPGLDVGASICHPVRTAARLRREDVLVGATLSRTLLAREGWTDDLETLRADLTGAAELAREIVEIHRFVENEWRSFCDRHGLTFDETSSRVEGELHGAHVSVELVVESAQPLRTKLRAELPARFVEGKVTIEDVRSAPLVRKVLARDLDLGVRELDARYNMFGDWSDELQANLRGPVWLATLELPGLTRLWIKDNAIVWTFTGCPPRAAELDVLAECIRNVCANRSNVGPYR